MNNKVAAIVTTYNRRELLKENIDALLNQTYTCDIILVNNASTDGTEEMIREINSENILYYNTGKNLGGAGGFSFGVAVGEKLGYHYLWLMDDDSIPKPNALESLIAKSEILENKFSFLASLVYWTDGNLFGMNVPSIRLEKYLKDLKLLSTAKVAPINACSFVGCFVNTDISRKVGLPIADFFIYGDDVEYTQRLRKHMPAYLDMESLIIHKAPSNKGADVVFASEDRIERYYYQIRNGMYIAKKNGFLKCMFHIKFVMMQIIKILLQSKSSKWKRITVVVKGFIAGIFYNPPIEYSEGNK